MTTIDRHWALEMCKAATPVFDREDAELREAKKELARLKALNFEQQLATKFGALNLYMDLFIEWKAAQALKKPFIRWEWGKLYFSSIQIFESDFSYCPIMSFAEFSILLTTAYRHY